MHIFSWLCSCPRGHTGGLKTPLKRDASESKTSLLSLASNRDDFDQPPKKPWTLGCSLRPPILPSFASTTHYRPPAPERWHFSFPRCWVFLAVCEKRWDKTWHQHPRRPLSAAVLCQPTSKHLSAFYSRATPCHTTQITLVLSEIYRGSAMVDMVSGTSFYVFSWLNLALLTLAKRQCYFPDGSVDSSSTPCDTSSDNSACCGPGNACLSNGYCFTYVDTMLGLGRQSCTDKTWQSDACPSNCNDGMP